MFSFAGGLVVPSLVLWKVKGEGNRLKASVVHSTLTLSCLGM